MNLPTLRRFSPSCSFVDDLERLAALVKWIRARTSTVTDQSKIGLANGAFDLFHVGHATYLEQAAERCHFLVVGVNSDASVKAAKGQSRPVVTAADRARLVSLVTGVNAVYVFDAPTVETIIRAIRPDYHFKGPDYTAASVPEAAVVTECGGQVVIVGRAKTRSTTGLIRAVAGTG